MTVHLIIYASIPEQSIPQTFCIINEQNNFGLDICGGSRDNNASLITYPFRGAPHQLFTVKNNCVIEASHSRLVLTVSKGNIESETPIVQFPENGDDSQLFAFYPDGTLRLRNRPEFCLQADRIQARAIVKLDHISHEPRAKWRLCHFLASLQNRIQRSLLEPYSKFSILNESNGMALQLHSLAQKNEGEFVIEPCNGEIRSIVRFPPKLYRFSSFFDGNRRTLEGFSTRPKIEAMVSKWRR